MRRRLVGLTVLAAAGGLLLLTGGFYLILSQLLERDADVVLQSRADAATSRLAIDNGRLTIEASVAGESSAESTWAFATDGRVVSRGEGDAAVQQAAESLKGVTRPTYRNVDDVRVLGQPASSGGRPVGTVVVDVSRVPYEHTEHIALVAALVLDTLVILGLGLLAMRLVSASLRPVGQMTKQAEEWSEQDPDRRFSLGPPHDELTHLAATLDSLLARLSASVRHERYLTEEIAHELRTPLARMRASAEVAMRRRRTDAELHRVLGGVVSDTEQLDTTITTLLRGAREPAGHAGTCDAEIAVRASVGAAEPSERDPAGNEVAIEVVSPEHPISVGCDFDAMTRMLTPVLVNAISYGSTSAVVTMSNAHDRVEIVVRDDGPGFQAAELEDVFLPGRRGSLSDHSPGNGLGLSLARRMARGIGGDVFASTGTGGVVTVSVPPG